VTLPRRRRAVESGLIELRVAGPFPQPVRCFLVMPWTRKLKAPIWLNDDRRLATLADARGLLLSLPDRRQQDEDWQYAARLLIGASRGRKVSMDDVRAQLTRVLKAGG
jgi:hypothetical protein